MRKTTRPAKDLSRPAQFKDFEQRRPVQLTFFELKTEEELGHSHLVELYDAIPRYHYGPPARTDGKFLEPLQRTFEHRKRQYRVQVLPAKVQEADGSWSDHYPSAREELVEDALRKLACEGQGAYLQDKRGVELASVFFSLYQLQQELKARGHTFSIAELKEAILVGNSATLRVEADNGRSVVSSSIFPDIYLQTQEDWKAEGKNSRCFVRFNPLVTYSINERSYRQFNYETVMSYRRSLSRWLHKRMAICFTQAAPDVTYTIRLSTILRDSGAKKYARLKDNIREVKLAFDEMKSRGVIDSYQVESIHDERRKNKVSDARFELVVSQTFTNEVIQANKRHRSVKELPLPLVKAVPGVNVAALSSGQ